MSYGINILKNYASTRLNADDTGAPKTCDFGGTLRARISSQCVKRTIRSSDIFQNSFEENMRGIRTRKMPELVADILRKNGVDEETIEVVTLNLSSFGLGEKGKPKTVGKTNSIIFFAPEEINTMANAIQDRIEEITKEAKDEKAAKKALKAEKYIKIIEKLNINGMTPDIALFGRMITMDNMCNVESASSVSQAISTTRTIIEDDYFTATDDLIFNTGPDAEDSGAAMLGSTNFNSACYYLYAHIDTKKLKENLAGINDVVDDIAKAAIKAFITAMCLDDPSGKQNSFASHPLPSAILIEREDDDVPMPISYHNAFLEDVNKKPGRDVVEKSINALVEEVEAAHNDFGLDKESYWFCSSKYNIDLNGAVKCSSFKELIDNIVDSI